MKSITNFSFILTICIQILSVSHVIAEEQAYSRKDHSEVTTELPPQTENQESISFYTKKSKSGAIFVDNGKLTGETDNLKFTPLTHFYQTAKDIVKTVKEDPQIIHFTNFFHKELPIFINSVVNEVIAQLKGETIPSTNVRNKRQVENICRSTGPPCSKPGIYSFKKSCTKFYSCYYDKKCKTYISTIRTCPKCFKYNAKKSSCDLPENVPECAYSNRIRAKNVCTRPGKFFVPDDCHSYYHCKNGTKFELTIKKCPESMTYDRKQRKCVKDNECKLPSVKCEKAETYVEDKFDCSKFYYCVQKNFSVPLHCPVPYIFNGGVCDKWEDIKVKWPNADTFFKD